MGKHTNGRKTGSDRTLVIGAIMFVLLLATALVFVLMLKPADSEYNNTIPAVMGVLTILTIAVNAFVVILKQEKMHTENKAKIDEVTHKLEDQ